MKKGIFLLCLIFISCGKSYHYYKKVSIEDQEWNYSQIPQFEFDIVDTTSKFNLILKVEHSDEFSFQNLYTNFHIILPTGEEVKDVVSLELADKFGKWQGNCHGNKCEIQILLRENINFLDVGAYQVRIEQYMRSETISGINSISLALDKI